MFQPTSCKLPFSPTCDDFSYFAVNDGGSGHGAKRNLDSGLSSDGSFRRKSGV